MTVLKEYNPATGTWDPILVGVAGPSGPTGPTGPTGPQGPAGVGAGGVGMPVAGAIGSQLVKKTATNYDAIWQTKPHFDVRDYGAVGNGVTNDTAALQATINAAAAAHGAVLITPGTYLVTGLTITGATRMAVIGMGIGCVITSTTNDDIFEVTACTEVTLSGFTIQGDGLEAKAAQRGVMFVDCTNCMVFGMRVLNTGYDGILFLTGDVGCSVIGCLVSGCRDDGINIGGGVNPTTDSTVVGNIVENSKSDGIHVSDKSQRTTVTGNTVRNCYYGIGFFGAQQVTISGNVVFGGGTTGTEGGIVTKSGATSSDVTIANNTVVGAVRGIFLAYGLQRFAVTGNIIKNPSDVGIFVSLSGPIRADAVVTGNIVSGAPATAGINAYGCTDVLVANNNVAVTASTGIRLGASTAALAVNRVAVRANMINAAGRGVEVIANDANTHLAIDDNIVTSAFRGIDVSAGSFVTINRNRVFAAGDQGIRLQGTAAGVFTNGEIRGNILDGGCTSYGIRVANYDDVAIADNVIKNITGATPVSIGSGTNRVLLQPNWGRWTGTQAEYDAVTPKDPYTLYVVV